MDAFDALNNINEYSLPKENDIKIYKILSDSRIVLEQAIVDALIYKQAYEYITGFTSKEQAEACLNDARKEVENDK